MVLSEQCRAVPEVVDRFPGILGGRISFPFHKIIRLSANSFEFLDRFSLVLSVFFFGVLELDVCCCSRTRRHPSNDHTIDDLVGT